MGVDGERDRRRSVPEPLSDLSGAEDAIVKETTGVEVPKVVGAEEGKSTVKVDLSQDVRKAPCAGTAEYEARMRDFASHIERVFGGSR